VWTREIWRSMGDLLPSDDGWMDRSIELLAGVCGSEWPGIGMHGGNSEWSHPGRACACATCRRTTGRAGPGRTTSSSDFQRVRCSVSRAQVTVMPPGRAGREGDRDAAGPGRAGRDRCPTHMPERTYEYDQRTIRALRSYFLFLICPIMH
jgi:hypothetical protein